MRDGEVGIVDDLLVVEEYVDVDNAVFVVAIHGLVSAPHAALDGLSYMQQCVWRVGGVDSYHSIEKGVCRLEAPGLGLNER